MLLTFHFLDANTVNNYPVEINGNEVFGNEIKTVKLMIYLNNTRNTLIKSSILMSRNPTLN